MKYEECFTDYEKMLHQGILDGFCNNQFQMLYEYLYKRKGAQFANDWMMRKKASKKRFCAEMLLLYIEGNTKLKEKAQKYINKCNKRGIE